MCFFLADRSVTTSRSQRLLPLRHLPSKSNAIAQVIDEKTKENEDSNQKVQQLQIAFANSEDRRNKDVEDLLKNMEDQGRVIETQKTAWNIEKKEMERVSSKRIEALEKQLDEQTKERDESAKREAKLMIMEVRALEESDQTKTLQVNKLTDQVKFYEKSFEEQDRELKKLQETRWLVILKNENYNTVTFRTQSYMDEPEKTPFRSRV
ncbi:unnamed protein product [Caenorhabditis brenneri]